MTSPSSSSMESIKILHAHLIVTGLYTHPTPITKVLSSYALSPPHLTHARLVFDQVENPTCFLFNRMIRGFAQSDAPADSITFYNRMRAQGLTQGNMTFPFVLKACARISAITDGKRVHCHAMKLGFISNIFVSNSLISLYASCGELGNARFLFDEMPKRDLVSWNALVCGYSQNRQLREALGVFEAMRAEGVKADYVTMTKVVTACTHLGDWELAENAVRYIEENGVEVDVYLGNTLIDYYGRRGLVESAETVFRGMKEKNTTTYNAMMTTYAKAKDLVSAGKIFDTMAERDLISWSCMITGYSQANQFTDALRLFREMQKAKVKPDEVVLASVLSACAHLGALSLGKWTHEYIQRNNIKTDIYLGNALIDMYSKCGCVMEAVDVFGGMKEKDITSWNSIICGLAKNGCVESALAVFSQMPKEGFWPNDISFIGVLIACAHGALVEKGLEYFDSMKEVYGVEPSMKHYGCVVDLLSRSGALQKALEFIAEMPMRPEPAVWRTLLGASMVHGDLEVGKIASKRLRELDPHNSGDLVLLSNTYATADKWNNAMEVREMMADTYLQKSPGCSSIEVTSSLEDDFIPSEVALSWNAEAVAD